MPQHRMVIARYNEDLSWIVDVPSDFSIVVYNKGEKLTDETVIQRAQDIVERPNLGREGETFLFHIINVRDAGNGFTVFTQGDPLGHSPDFINILKAWELWEPIQTLGCQWKASHPPETIVDKYHNAPLGNFKVRPELFSLFTWSPLHFLDVGTYKTERFYRMNHELPPGTNIAAHFFREMGFARLAEQAEHHTIGRFAYGAIFAARNDLLAGLAGELLENIRLAILNREVNGYMWERLWLHLLGEKFLLPVSG